MPSGVRLLAVEFDFIDHVLHLRTDDGDSRRLRLQPRSVADFHARYMEALREFGIDIRMLARPVEVEKASSGAASTWPAGALGSRQPGAPA